MRSKAADRLRLNSVDREGTAVDPPARTRAQIFVVVAQVPGQVGHVIAVDGEMVCNTGDSTERIVGVASRSEDLADYRVLCPRNARQRRHRRPDAVVAAVDADGVE